MNVLLKREIINVPRTYLRYSVITAIMEALIIDIALSGVNGMGYIFNN